jgi:hypothetical protein
MSELPRADTWQQPPLGEESDEQLAEIVEAVESVEIV